jgi:hypothetical protein
VRWPDSDDFGVQKVVGQLKCRGCAAHQTGSPPRLVAARRAGKGSNAVKCDCAIALWGNALCLKAEHLDTKV